MSENIDTFDHAAEEKLIRRLLRVAGVESRCRLLIVPLLRGSSRFQSSILSHHVRFKCGFDKEEVHDDDECCAEFLLQWPVLSDLGFDA